MLDTQPLAHQALITAGEVFGFELTREFCLSLLGLNEQDSIAEIEKHVGTPVPTDDYLATFRKHYEILLSDGVPTKPGLPELIMFLEEKGIPKAVATSSNRGETQTKLGQHDLLKHFEVIITADDITRVPVLFFLVLFSLLFPSQCARQTGLPAITLSGLRKQKFCCPQDGMLKHFLKLGPE